MKNNKEIFLYIDIDHRGRLMYRIKICYPKICFLIMAQRWPSGSFENREIWWLVSFIIRLVLLLLTFFYDTMILSSFCLKLIFYYVILFDG